jgi:hypothetical protein
VEIREEIQANPVADEVAALVAVTRPILNGVLVSIGAEYLDPWGGDRTQVPLKLLGRLRKEGDGDTGIAFEYAVHDAVRGKNAVVVERVSEALELCRIRQGNPASILFAIEKQGSKQLIETDLGLITDESRVLSGKQGQPVKLKKQMNTIAAAFRRANTRPNLPQSIRGLWKADLFLGSRTPDHWVGTSVKIHPSHMESAAGLRIAIVPTQSGRTDRVRKDDHRNLVICPIPRSDGFGWPQRDGLKWPHLALVDVAGGSVPERAVMGSRGGVARRAALERDPITARASWGGWGRVSLWPRVRPWRKRQDSVPVSMMCARWVRRSTTALASLGSAKTLVHSPKGRFVVTISDPRSWRSESTWKTSSAAPSGSAR